MRKSGTWIAAGMLKDWCDTPLGDEFPTRAAAMQAIVDWWLMSEQVGGG